MSNNTPSQPGNESRLKSIQLYDRENILAQLMPARAQKAPDWSWFFDLGPELLRDIDPVPLILNQLTELRLILPYRQSLFTILSELYNNAIEHGVLGLSSELKQTPEGFATYFEQRESRLNTLADGWVTIQVVKYSDAEELAWLHITLEDSGEGFDYEIYRQNTINTEKPSGRGIHIVENLCEAIRYSQHGRRVDVVYNLNK